MVLTYKHYNSKFNRFIAKLNSSISEEVIEYETIIQKDETEIKIPIKNGLKEVID